MDLIEIMEDRAENSDFECQVSQLEQEITRMDLKLVAEQPELDDPWEEPMLVVEFEPQDETVAALVALLD